MLLKDLFPIPTEAQWLKVVQKELKDIAFESLAYRNEDGIKVQPNYSSFENPEPRPIKTSFPEYVSFFQFPHSAVGYLELQDALTIPPSAYETLFLSIPMAKIPDFVPPQNAYIQVQDLFQPAIFERIFSEWDTLTNKFKGIILDLAFLQECGANNVDAISLGLWFLEKIPQNTPIILKISVGGDFYTEIAKLRALNYVLEDFGLSNVKIWAKTAAINKTLLHLENNLIRLTTETLASVLGGCHYITILPFDLDFSEEFSARISANILRILLYEAYLDKVSDPLRGSFAIESLTQSYLNHFFQQLIFWKTLTLQDLLKTFTEKAHQNLRKIVEQYHERQRLLIGVNLYPYAKETRQEVKMPFPQTLQPIRIAQLIA